MSQPRKPGDPASPEFEDPREWLLADAREAMTDPPPPEALPRAPRAPTVAEAAREPIPAPVVRASSWTPANVTAMAITIMGLLGGAKGLSEILGSSERTRAEIKAAIVAQAEIEAKARDAITQRLVATENQQRWLAAGLCIVNGKPLHPSQPCGLTVTTQSRGPGAEVGEAFGRLP